VAVYFCDSSAIVKRYAAEQGTAWLTGVTDPAAGNRVFVAAITGAEVIAALARKRRGLHLSATDAATAITRFHHDYANEFLIVEVTAAIISSAMALADKHFLRGYDAVQLAAAIQTQHRRDARGLPALTLITADDDLLDAGVAEGLLTDNPNVH
jgi:predicted nucleic acid-binding protein